MNAACPQAKSIFGQALAIADPAERTAYVATACNGDAALRAEVESLLAALEQAGAFLAQPAVVQGADTMADGAGNTIGAAAELPPEFAAHPRYRILQRIGQGGMGTVYRAEHRRMGRCVAIKVINPGLIRNAAMVERFQQEVRAAAHLHHPNIVTAYDADQAGALHFLVMEYVEGRSLAEVVAERGPLPVRRACAAVRQAALGLQHAFEQGMVHRDIKPQNLMLVPSPAARGASGETVKVLDFGLVRLAHVPDTRGAGTAASAAPLTDAGIIMGTADYIAPEQAADPRRADIRADIYSLGCTLFHLLAGRPPFPGGTVKEKLACHARDPLPLRGTLPDAPPELVAVVARMTAKAPADRYATPADVATALAPFAAPPGQPDAGVRRNKHRLARLVGVAAVLFAVVLLGGIVLRLTTDRGTIIVQTDDDAMELAVQQGRVIRIRDTKSGETWNVDAQDYRIARADTADGLTIELPRRGTLTLRRRHGGKVTVTTSDDAGDAPGPTVESELAVRRGLDWLARMQSADGRWRLDGEFQDKGVRNDTAGTAFGLLPFLAAGMTHQETKDNRFADRVHAGLRFLVQTQDRRTGDLGGGMYAHALATRALCEAYGRTRDPALKQPAQRAVDYIVQAQHQEGGWRYGPGQPGDLSVTGWQIAALSVAKAAGLAVPAQTFQGAIAFLDRACDQNDEGYGYLPGSGKTPTMSAEGLLCRQYLQGWDRQSPRLLKGVRTYLERNPPPPPGGAPVGMYYFYHATQVMHHLGGAAWRAWNDKMRVSLTATQDQSNDPEFQTKGSWRSPPNDPFAPAGGRLMQTALSLLTLEVYYRDRWMDAKDQPKARDARTGWQ